MYLQTLKNMLIFFAMLAFWLVLVCIEVLTGYSGVFLQIIYGTTLFSLFVAFWLVNRATVRNIQNEFLQFFASGALALVLTGLFLVTMLVVGSALKNVLVDWLK